MQLSHKHKNFSEFFAAFLKSRSNFEHIEKKITVIPNDFLKLRPSKNALR